MFHQRYDSNLFQHHHALLIGLFQQSTDLHQRQKKWFKNLIELDALHELVLDDVAILVPDGVPPAIGDVPLACPDHLGFK